MLIPIRINIYNFNIHNKMIQKNIINLIIVINI